jgi:A predicted alpha-helical domain with a conserved ER motif.
MLSRVADSIYWMGRYIERAENVARFIDVNLQLMLDLPLGFDDQWHPLVSTSYEVPSHSPDHFPLRGAGLYFLSRPASDSPLAAPSNLSVYCPDVGWIDVDPTNNLIPASRHITLAWGRDYSDVSPIRGVIQGGGHHRLAVSVHVTPIAPDSGCRPSEDESSSHDHNPGGGVAV